MARTVTWNHLRQLAAFEAANGCAISLYLDLDPSTTPTAGDAETRLHSLLDQGAKSDGAAKDLSHEQRISLRSDFDRIRSYFDQEFDRDGARGLALFCDGLDELWEPMPLVGAVRDDVRVERRLYLVPLVALVGRGEGALVVVVGREQGKIYRLHEGQLEELEDLYERQLSRHDQGGLSQARYQRHVDYHAVEHLRTVAAELDRLVRSMRGVEVVVMAPEESRAEFEGLLSSEVRQAVAGSAHAEAHARPAELLQLAAPILDRSRSERERELLERWREEAGRSGRAASGWEATLEAASDARVEVLLYSEGREREAWQCPACGRASASAGSCPLDGTQMERVETGTDVAVHQTLRHGGSVWPVEQARDLDPVEGVGALLRF
jgi:peptide chain release factor subunit 1